MKLGFILFSFVCVGGLLFLNHAGIAIRVTNWIFYLLVLAALWKLYNAKN